MKRLIVLACLLSLAVSCASPRPWTRPEKVALGLSWAAAAADTYTTIRVLNSSPNVKEINPAMGERPNNGEVMLHIMGTQVLFTLLVHYFFPNLRIPGLFSKTVVNGGWAIHNSKVYSD